MRDANGESILKAKNAFELTSAKQGITIISYHADNGRRHTDQRPNMKKSCFLILSPARLAQ